MKHTRLLTVLLLAPLAGLNAAGNANPNILHIHADDHRPDGLRALGNPLLVTPNLDKLVERGMTFTHCYTMGSMVGAVCTPSRTMMLTGRSWQRIPGAPGAASNAKDPTTYLPRVIQAAGYQTWHMGKYGNGFPTGLAEFETSIRDDANGNTPETDRAHSGQRLADETIAFLKSRTASKETKPFYIYLAPPVPHDPRSAEPQFHKLYDPNNVPLSPAFLPQHPFDNGEMTVRDEKLAPWPRTPEDTKQQNADYYSCVTGLDHHVGRIFAELKASGQWDNTIIIFSGDNGLSLGEHGLFGKQNLYEFGGMHVPLVIAGPGIPKGKSEALVYLMDLFPTFAEFAGAKLPTDVEGKSIVPLLNGKQTKVRDVLYTGYRTCQRAIRDDRWKLIRYPLVNRTQLFDLNSDPHELVNLAAKPEHATKVAELTTRLTQEMAHYADTSPLTVANPQPAEWSPPTSGKNPAKQAKSRDSKRALQQHEGAQRKPNIIVILVDDMGFSDLSCYGSEIPTPNLDGLAKNGLRFTQFYNTGRCCPTRASLLTGLYPHQAGVGHMMENKGLPGYQGHLNDTCVTMAEVLKPAGYFTAMTGKWHVGQEQGVVPWERGFDRSLNAPAGGFYYGTGDRAKLFLNGKALANDDPCLPKNWYSTDLWTQYGIKFIDEALAEKKPFFLYLAHNAPHFPLQASAEDIAKFRNGIYTNGWDTLRVARYERQKAMGLIDPAWKLTPRATDVKPWDSLSAAEKDRFDNIMAIYAACVWHMDKSIGDLVAALKQRNVLDNTLILFMSDNGGNAEGGPNGTFKGDNPGDPKSTVFCGESWANLENTPNRLYKHFNHEGGVSTPLIAHYPAGILAKGEFRTQPGHLVDIMATVADFGGATYPKEFKGKTIQPMEGRSLRPAFINQPIEREAIYWEHEGNAAVRIGDWKLVRRGRNNAWELYDLKADRTEMNNLAAAQPERVQQMTTFWNTWAIRANVLPGPEGKPKNEATQKKGNKKKAKQ